MIRRRTATRVLAIVFCSILASGSTGRWASADDWPQWMGPGRDNVWRETGIISSFADGPPEVCWRTPIAGGYAGPAVAQGRVVIADYVTNDDVKVPNFERKNFSGVERVRCLDATTGDVVWEQEYPVKYTISYPAGPRCTPLIDGELVYSLGAEGDLLCLDLESGEVLWRKNLAVTYQTKAALWGYAAHPLIDGNKLITLGGGEQSHIVALDKTSGDEIWTSGTASEQGYSPPLLIDQAGSRQLIVVSPDHVRSVNPESGEEFWSVPYEASNGSIIMTPVVHENYLYVAGYSGRSLLLELNQERPGAEEVWRDKRKIAISPVNVQPIVDDGVLYGVDQSGDLAALELPSGERLWATPKPISDRRRIQSGTAFLVKHQDRYWMFTESGDLVIAELGRDGFRELDRAHVIEPTNVAFGRDVVWSMPAFANRRAYIRNDEEIICVDLAQSTD